jgi:hypothetical protein
MKTRLLAFLATALLLCSCSSDSGRFRIEGRLRNMNFGEFWVYSPDGGFEGIDTIKVRNSRFEYEWNLQRPATLVVIFPNFSEQPVFAEPHATVEMKGDATHLKELTIEGTDDNEEMTKLRMNLNKLMPPEIPAAVAAFVSEHPTSPVSRYLLYRYFEQPREADYATAAKLAVLLMNADPQNEHLKKRRNQFINLQHGALKSKCPPFTVTDVKGRRVTEKIFSGKVSVVTAWASWSYRSTDQQRRLQMLKEDYGDDLAVLSICVDGRPDDCKNRVERDSLKWSTICDGRMWDTPLLARFGMADVPANVVIDRKGRVVARNLEPRALEDKLKAMLKK